MSRAWIAVLLMTQLAAYEPPAGEVSAMLWTWAGRCESPSCAEEARSFLTTTAVWYQVQHGDGTSTVEWRGDGTLLIDGEPYRLSTKQSNALRTTLDEVRADLAGGTSWQQTARVLPPGARFVLAFAMDQKIHAVSGGRDSVRKEYLPLIELLQDLVDPAAAARGIPAADETRIIGYRVRHDMPDHLAVEVEYFYDGSHGTNVFLGANPVNETGVVMTGFRPGPIVKGRHKACTVVTTYSESPEEFTTDTLKIELYVGGSSVFLEEHVPLEKEWRKSAIADHSCCDSCSRGCAP